MGIVACDSDCRHYHIEGFSGFRCGSKKPNRRVKRSDCSYRDVAIITRIRNIRKKLFPWTD